MPVLSCGRVSGAERPMIQSLSAWLDIKIDRRAVTGVEYGLIAGVIAATITLAVSFITIG